MSVACAIVVSFALTVIQSVLLRYHALVALRKSIATAGRAITDSAMKDVLKQAKSALSDKALPVQRAAADVSLKFSAYSIIYLIIYLALDYPVPFWRWHSHSRRCRINCGPVYKKSR